MPSRSICAAAALTLLFIAGCGPGKLDITKEYDMDGDPQMIFCPPQPKPQKITVEFESDKSDIVVMLIKSADIPKEEESNVPTSKAIEFKKGKSGSFSGDVPANTETTVLLRGGLKTHVKVRVHNQAQ